MPKRPPFQTALLPAATAALAAALAGCDRAPAASGGDAAPGGTVVVAAAAEPGNILPVLPNTTQGQSIYAQLFDRLAEIGPALNTVGDQGFRPRLARSWAWAPDSLSVRFALDAAARWHDGRPVTAADVAFSFRLATDPRAASPVAPLLANVDSVTAPDSATAVVWFARRSPQQFFDAVYHLYVLPEHRLRDVAPDRLAASPFAREPVGSGRFRFARWERGQRLELEAVPDHWRGRAKLDRLVWAFAPDFGTATIRLLAGDADFVENLRPETLGQMTRSRSLRLVPYPSLDYGFLQFNLRAADASGAAHPLFADRELRRALTMAVDRERVVRNVFDSLAYTAVGPVPRAVFPDWERLRQLPYDVARARALLDSLGWRDADGDGTRERDGVPLAFGVLVPTSSQIRQRLAVLMQEQLRGVGARVTVEPLEIGVFVDRLNDRRFDAAMGGWHTDPSPAGIRETWGVIGTRTSGGSNYGSYESRAFETAVDSALDANSPERSRAHWLRAYQTILDDAPAVWLFEPRLVAGVHRRIQVAGLRADGWWAELDEWSIPLGARIGRDRVGGR
ncbi:peptide ABC transporter substrate-binding protein [Roseisolibacter sp. H3M3-2]|uniref:peptide ABC transporter substrate-binding protein n=1 Tax=Roseisolibacter sp. H3M3-2 TaxID=3031323 RepID=UPI0023DCA923|nr:peptide ABC transporter substrate-binding protein [Roseisolibacter sp. H3M3-2]MDF1504095.1 peptide ABC transporter substrate-binding protein [Roseisolibacter sp. H3M3-2]